ncbi:MAG: hypothetical protein ABJF10_10315 [Chthoniobacter sp.]|uniref:hypothetical protein n=1 Tax=Chthoniobacter sp. TaxID=2510640 RepID=UPI0032A99255
MPITYVIEEKRKLVRTDVVGAIAVQEILGHLASQKKGQTVTYREIVDVRGVTPPYLSSSQIWQAAQAALAVVLECPAGPRALVVTHEAVYGMCRMFSTLVEETFPIRVFRDPIAAEHWLMEEHQPIDPQ